MTIKANEKTGETKHVYTGTFSVEIKRVRQNMFLPARFHGHKKLRDKTRFCSNVFPVAKTCETKRVFADTFSRSLKQPGQNGFLPTRFLLGQNGRAKTGFCQHVFGPHKTFSHKPVFTEHKTRETKHVFTESTIGKPACGAKRKQVKGWDGSIMSGAERCWVSLTNRTQNPKKGCRSAYWKASRDFRMFRRPRCEAGKDHRDSGRLSGRGEWEVDDERKGNCE